MSEDKLNALHTTSMKRALSEAIKEADGIAWMLGGIDLSLNDDTQKKLDIGWQPQFYGFADVVNLELSVQGAAGYLQPNQNSAKAGPDQRMRWFGKGNFLRLQDRVCPAHRLPNKSGPT